MRYRLFALVALTAIAPPIIGAIWLYAEELALLFTLFAIPGLFVLWYWMLLKSQAMDPRTRGGDDFNSG